MYLIDTNEGRRVCTRLGRTSKGHNGSARVCTHQHLPYLPDAHPSTNLSQSTQRPQTNFAPNQASTTNNFTLRDLDEEQEMGVYVIELGFTGVYGFGLFGERDTNFPVVAPDPAHPGFFYLKDGGLPSHRPDGRFNAIRTNENTRTSSYNGGYVSITKRLSNHFQFNGSYTYSKLLTSTEDFFGLSEPGDPRNIRAERGPAFNDWRLQRDHTGRAAVFADGERARRQGLRREPRGPGASRVR